MTKQSVPLSGRVFGHGSVGLILCLAVAAQGCAERPAKRAAARPAASASAGANEPAPVVNDKTQFALVDDVAALLALPAVGSCTFDILTDVSAKQVSAGPDEKTFLGRRDRKYRLGGFATDSDAGTVPEDIRILLRSKNTGYALVGKTGIDRPGVVKFFDKPSLAKAGFSVDAGFANVEPGRYEVFVIKDSHGTISPTHMAVLVE